MRFIRLYFGHSAAHRKRNANGNEHVITESEDRLVGLGSELAFQSVVYADDADCVGDHCTGWVCWQVLVAKVLQNQSPALLYHPYLDAHSLRLGKDLLLSLDPERPSDPWLHCTQFHDT